MASVALTAPLVQSQMADRRPVSPKHGTVGVMTSGTAYTTPIPTKIIVVITTATTIAFTMLDGTTVTMGSVPIGCWTFDLQVTTVTLGTPANGVIAGFYNITD
jgi:hypothetical protein